MYHTRVFIYAIGMALDYAFHMGSLRMMAWSVYIMLDV